MRPSKKRETSTIAAAEYCGEVKAATGGHSNGGDDKDGGGSGQAAGEAAGVQDGACPDEADAWDDLGGDPSVIGGTRRPVHRESTVKSAAPKQINMFVRSPAARCLNSRSRPMRPPRIAASRRRVSELPTMPLAISRCNKSTKCCQFMIAYSRFRHGSDGRILSSGEVALR